MRFLLATIACFLTIGCASTPKRGDIDHLNTARMGFTLRVSPPKDFLGPGLSVFPGYDSWGYSQGIDPDAVYLSIRVYYLGDHLPDDAPDEAVAAYFRDTFINPVVTTISHVTINGKEVPIREVLNVDGHQYQCDFHYESAYVNIMFSAEQQDTLSRYRQVFLDFLHSLTIEGSRAEQGAAANP